MGIIRLLLAISVVLSHGMPIYGNSLIGGPAAVRIFYIISGFYMGLILDSKYKTDVKSFYRNRFLKIFPIYWFVQLMSIIFYGYIYLRNPDQINPFQQILNLSGYHSIWVILIQIIIIGLDLFLFIGFNTNQTEAHLTNNYQIEPNPGHHYMLIPQAWSLSLELMFYALIPFINKWKIKWIILTIILSFFARFAFYYLLKLDFDPWTYRFFPFEIGFFLLGTLSYKLSKYLNRINISGLYFTAIFILSMMIFSYFPNLDYQLKSSLLTIFIILTLPKIFEYFSKSKLDRKVGELSYPVYIVHILVFKLLRSHVDKPYLTISAIIVSILISIVILKLYYLYIEPKRKIKNNELRTELLS